MGKGRIDRYFNKVDDFQFRKKYQGITVLHVPYFSHLKLRVLQEVSSRVYGSERILPEMSVRTK